ncbi:MAG: phosphopantetheine-binding protein [Pseudoxanthomonas sp.]
MEARHVTTLTVARSARLSGFLVWLNLYPDEQECIDILAQEHSWIPVFLPVFDTGVEVAEGTRITMRIARVLCENGRNPDYVIDGELDFPDGRRLPWQYTAHHIGGSYRQSPFYTRLFAGESVTSPPKSKNPPAAHALEDRLRSFLAQRLPHYMIPAAFVRLDALPLSPNGKVDRRALPAPSAADRKRTAVSALPQGPAELQIAAIWQELLHVERVGRHDNFFTLGGHSLLVAKVILRIQDALGVEIPIRALYETPTVAGLGELVRRYGHAAPLGENLCFDPQLELAQEAVLPADITARGLEPVTPVPSCATSF